MIESKLLLEQAQELIKCGNSKEKAEGYGIEIATTILGKYEKGYHILLAYFDSISDEEQIKVSKKLKKLNL